MQLDRLVDLVVAAAKEQNGQPFPLVAHQTLAAHNALPQMPLVMAACRRRAATAKKAKARKARPACTADDYLRAKGRI